MDIADFLEQTSKGIIPIDVLTAIAGAKAAMGDDVAAAFRSQAEQRTAAMQAFLTTAENAQRELLADEDRRFKRLDRERETVLSLLRHVEQRIGDAYRVPESQASALATRTTEEVSPVLTREQKVSEYLTRRGGALYHGDRGAAQMRFGAIVRALALGDRQGLSELERRALSEGTDAAGGFTVPEILGGQFIDRVRNAMVLMRAGAMTVPMTSDTLHLARLAQPGMHTNTSPLNSAANWKTENDTITEAEMTLERVTFTARTLPMLIRLSVELSEDSSNIDAIIETEMSKAMAVELDRAGLRGEGVAPTPRGIRYQSGVTITAVNAAKTNYDWLIDAIGAVWGENFEPNARIYDATLATAIAKYKSTVDAQPLIVPPAVAALQELRSNQAYTGEAYIGDFTQVMIGLRTGFRLEVSRVAGDSFDKLQIAVRAYLRADVQLAHPEAFVVAIGVS